MTHGDDDKPDRARERILQSVSDSDPLVGAASADRVARRGRAGAAGENTSRKAGKGWLAWAGS
jgi:hypothetical protein